MRESELLIERKRRLAKACGGYLYTTMRDWNPSRDAVNAHEFQGHYGYHHQNNFFGLN